MKIVLEAHGVSKSLPNGKMLLKNISFSVRQGECVGFLGPSGAGKSLTIRCILGLIKPDAGQVVLHTTQKSYTMSKAAGGELRLARRDIGVIFQGLNLVQRLTVLENVMIGRLGRMHPLRCWVYGFKDSEAQGALEVLDRLGMSDLAARRASSLSGGELQRVAIARAMFQQPCLFLADEPISSLDPKTAERIMRLLRTLSHENPVLCSLHQPEMARLFCTRLIGIRSGEVVYDGSPDLKTSTLRDIYGQDAEQLFSSFGAGESSGIAAPVNPPTLPHIMAGAGT